MALSRVMSQHSMLFDQLSSLNQSIATTETSIDSTHLLKSDVALVCETAQQHLEQEHASLFQAAKRNKALSEGAHEQRAKLTEETAALNELATAALAQESHNASEKAVFITSCDSLRGGVQGMMRKDSGNAGQIGAFRQQQQQLLSRASQQAYALSQTVRVCTAAHDEVDGEVLAAQGGVEKMKRDVSVGQERVADVNKEVEGIKAASATLDAECKALKPKAMARTAKKKQASAKKDQVVVRTPKGVSAKHVEGLFIGGEAESDSSGEEDMLLRPVFISR